MRHKGGPAPFPPRQTDNWIYGSFFIRPGGKSLVWLNGYGVRGLDLRTKARHRGYDVHGPEAMYAMGAQWSPTGSRVAVTHEYEALQLCGSTGSRVAVVKVPGSSKPSTSSLAWTKNGKALFVAQADGAIARVDGSSGRILSVLRKPDPEDGDIMYSTDLALNREEDVLASIWQNGVILLWDLKAGGEPRRLQEAIESANGGGLSFSPDGTWLVVSVRGVVKALRVKGEPAAKEIAAQVTDEESQAGLHHRVLGWDESGTLYVLDAGGTLLGWSARTEKVELRHTVGRGATEALLTADRRLLAVAKRDVTVLRLADRRGVVLRIVEEEGRLSSTVLADESPRRPLSAAEAAAFFAP